MAGGASLGVWLAWKAAHTLKCGRLHDCLIPPSHPVRAEVLLIQHTSWGGNCRENVQGILWGRERHQVVAVETSGEDDSLWKRAPFSLAVLRGGIFSDPCKGQTTWVRLR